MTLPRLSGERVTLVPISHELAAGIVAGDAESALRRRGLRPGDGWPHADTLDGMRPLAEHGSPGDESGWLITLEGDVIGDLGWMGGPAPDGDAEIGYGLAAPYRGRGLGMESVGLLAAWAEQQPGVRRVIARVLPGNAPSWRLLLRLGFVEDGHEPPYVRYVRDRPHLDRIDD